MAWCFSTRASVATVLTTHPCVSRCLRVKYVLHHTDDLVTHPCEILWILCHTEMFLTYIRVSGGSKGGLGGHATSPTPPPPPHHPHTLYRAYINCWGDPSLSHLWYTVWTQLHSLLDPPMRVTLSLPLSHTDYRKISNIRLAKSPNLDVSRLVVPNPMKPGVKSRMKM